MSESDMRRHVVQGLRGLHGVSIENAVGIGTPDVNCAAGWLELKWARGWPKRSMTPLRLRHYTDQQRRWLDRRWRAAGGRGAWLLLQVRRDWLIFRGCDAGAVGTLARPELFELAAAHWVGKHAAMEELPKWLTKA